jgi:polysaccharide deacetylase family protein (PEP-CTERM system associated)
VRVVSKERTAVPAGKAASGPPAAVMTVDVEDWFHILDSPVVPGIEDWAGLESRVERNTERVLDLFEGSNTRATFFWLGWLAQRHKALVRRCQQAGHEIASHGYGHVLAGQVGRDGFRSDVIRAKGILEDITGRAVAGLRAPGFGVTNGTGWVFDEIRRAGHRYDSSVFPGSHAHGGLDRAHDGPHVIPTRAGRLVECPTSVVSVLGRRLALFGGGYLRLAPAWLIRWGIRRLRAASRPLVVYVHPREIDPRQPRLPLRLTRRFKCYVNLRTTMPKLKWLCREHEFRPMCELAERTGSSRPAVPAAKPQAA